MSEGPSPPRGGSTTARHTAPRRGLGPLLPSRSHPLPRPPTRHVPASPARPIFRPVPSTSLVQPAPEWHDAVYSRALPRQRLRHAESASSRYRALLMETTAESGGIESLQLFVRCEADRIRMVP